MDKYIACVGDVAVDFIVPYADMKRFMRGTKEGTMEEGPKPEVHRCPGGTSGNTATILSQLGSPTLLCTKITTGSQGKFLQRDLVKYDINTDYCIVDGDDYQIMMAILDDNDRVMFKWQDSSVDRELFRHNEIPDEVALKSDIVHIAGVNVWSGTEQGHELARFAERAKELGCIVSVDLNLRLETFGFSDERRAMYEKIINASDIVFGSDADEFGVFTEIADFETSVKQFNNKFPGKIIVARHGKEDTLLIADDQCSFFPSLDVDVVNKVGAGDSFDAGFLHAYHKGDSLQKCVKTGIACAAYTITHKEAHAAPSITELRILISRQK